MSKKWEAIVDFTIATLADITHYVAMKIEKLATILKWMSAKL